MNFSERNCLTTTARTNLSRQSFQVNTPRLGAEIDLNCRKPMKTFILCPAIQATSRLNKAYTSLELQQEIPDHIPVHENTHHLELHIIFVHEIIAEILAFSAAVA